MKKLGYRLTIRSKVGGGFSLVTKITTPYVGAPWVHLLAPATNSSFLPV